MAVCRMRDAGKLFPFLDFEEGCGRRQRVVDGRGGAVQEAERATLRATTSASSSGSTGLVT